MVQIRKMRKTRGTDQLIRTLVYYLSFLDLYLGFDFMSFSLYQIMGTDQENHGKLGVQIKLRHLICTPVLSFFEHT